MPAPIFQHAMHATTVFNIRVYTENWICFATLIRGGSRIDQKGGLVSGDSFCHAHFSRKRDVVAMIANFAAPAKE